MIVTCDDLRYIFKKFEFITSFGSRKQNFYISQTGGELQEYFPLKRRMRGNKFDDPSIQTLPALIAGNKLLKLRHRYRTFSIQLPFYLPLWRR